MLTVIGGLLVQGLYNPTTFYTLMREDGWAEWGTFLTFFMAGLLAIDRLIRHRTARLERLTLAGLSVFCLFVAGEEISWGQRLIGFTAPEIFLRSNYQQEFELHNILRCYSDSELARSRFQVALLAGVYALAALVGRLRHVPRALPPHILILPLLIACVALEYAYPFHRTGEFAELLLGMAFLTDICLRRRQPQQGHGSRLAALSLLTALLLAALLPMTLNRLVYGGASKRNTLARQEVEMIANDIRRPRTLLRRALSTSRFHKRIYTAILQHYITFGNRSTFLERQRSPAEAPQAGGRSDRKGYFVDPWGQSYWVVHEYRPPASWGILIYSFGVNRQRELTARDLHTQFTASGPVAGGDDIGYYINMMHEFPGGTGL